MKPAARPPTDSGPEQGRRTGERSTKDTWDSAAETPGGNRYDDRGHRANAFKGQAKSQFDAWADSYDHSILHHFLFRPSYVVMMAEIADWYGVHQRSFKVLDLGCGTGNFIQMLSHSPWPVSVVGVDFSPAMCRQGKDKVDQAKPSIDVTFVTGDSEHLPFPDESFDIVVCANSFHHYPHQHEVIGEVHRVLLPSGRFILLDGFRDNSIGWFVYDVVIARIEKDIHHAAWSELHGHFSNAGFRKTTHRKFNVLFPVLCTIGDR